MSWKAEVQTVGSVSALNKWSTNTLRFATEEEASSYAVDLACRWTAVTTYRATETDEPVNYVWDGVRAVRINEVPT